MLSPDIACRFGKQVFAIRNGCDDLLLGMVAEVGRHARVMFLGRDIKRDQKCACQSKLNPLRLGQPEHGVNIRLVRDRGERQGAGCFPPCSLEPARRQFRPRNPRSSLRAPAAARRASACLSVVGCVVWQFCRCPGPHEDLATLGKRVPAVQACVSFHWLVCCSWPVAKSALRVHTSHPSCA